MKTATRMAWRKYDRCPTCAQHWQANIDAGDKAAGGPVYFVEIFDDDGQLICTSAKWQSGDDAEQLVRVFRKIMPLAYIGRGTQILSNT